MTNTNYAYISLVAIVAIVAIVVLMSGATNKPIKNVTPLDTNHVGEAAMPSHPCACWNGEGSCTADANDHCVSDFGSGHPCTGTCTNFISRRINSK